MMNFAKDEEKSLKLLGKGGYKVCPYTSYETAAEYERETGYTTLTNLYDKKTWYKVACKSIPITKTDCDDMYCGKHNPERIRHMRNSGVTVSNKITGCGRKIKWCYWIPVKDNFDKKIYSVYRKPQSDITDVVRSYGILEKPIKCSFCRKENTCVFMKCTHYKCRHNNKLICGNCIIDSKLTSFSDVRVCFYIIKQNLNLETKKYEDDKLEEYKFIKNRNGIYTCIIYENNQTDMLSVDKDGKIQYHRSKRIFGYLYNEYDLSNKNVYSKDCYAYNTVFSKDQPRLFEEKYKIAYCFAYDYKKYKNIFNFYYYECFDNHIQEFYGLDALKDKIANLDEFKPINDAAKIINIFIRRKNTMNKWYIIVHNVLQMRARMKKGKSVIRKMFNKKKQKERSEYLRKEWDRIIKTVIERLDELKAKAQRLLIAEKAKELAIPQAEPKAKSQRPLITTLPNLREKIVNPQAVPKNDDLKKFFKGLMNNNNSRVRQNTPKQDKCIIC